MLGRRGVTSGLVTRALPALAFGIVLALALDQPIRLLPPPSTQENQHWYLQTVQYHPLLGWSGYPNFVSTKDGIPIQTNSLGYRDREPVEVEAGQKLSVLFLGDSFTWGDEVRLEERFTSLLEASCGFVCDRLPALRAINKGIIGYGTAQSLLDYVLARDERPFEVVILALYTGNDLTDNAAVDSPSGPRPRLIRCDRESAGQDLCVEGVPIPPAVDWPEHRFDQSPRPPRSYLRLERPDHLGKPAPRAPVSHREADRRPDGRCVEHLAVPDRQTDIGGTNHGSNWPVGDHPAGSAADDSRGRPGVRCDGVSECTDACRRRG